MDALPRISVIGLGRLGSPLAACLASRGFQVVGYDPVVEKVEALAARRSLHFEPGFEELMATVGPELRATTDLRDAVMSTDISIVAVPTPMAPDGSLSLASVLPTCQDIGRILADVDRYHLVAVASTVMPGSTRRRIAPAIEEVSGKTIGPDIGLCYSAVYVTMGNVIQDFLRPSLALIGEWDRRSGDAMQALYERVCEIDPPIVRMSIANAELTKLAVNVFVTTKISFANFLARVCERMPGGDVDVVTSAMQMDPRIGEGALCGAVSYGGPFFDKDNQALGAMLKRFDVAPELVGVLGKFNRAQVPWLTDRVHERVPDGGTVGVLGLAYKPNTDVIDESLGIQLCQRLHERGVRVVAFDPAAMPYAREALPPGTALAESVEDCIRGADVVVVATPWPAWCDVTPAVWGRTEAPRVVVDCWRELPALATAEGVTYVPLGIGPGVPETPDRESAGPSSTC